MPRSPRLSVAESTALALVEPGLASVAAKVGLIGRATPIDAHVERARLLADYTAGRERLPRWRYDERTRDVGSLERELAGIEGPLRSLEGTPLGLLYRGRAEELRLELRAAAAAGTAGTEFGEAARARYPPTRETPEAAALARRWCEAPAEPHEPGVLASDDRDPRSLVSRLRAEVSRRKLPFAVRTSPSMSALAAISGDTLWVAEGRLLTARDIERTVVHEVQAHALPRMQAKTHALGIFAIGTAGGSDDQEGYALWLEDRRGVSGEARRRELGARHDAVRRMREGADFVTVVRTVRALGLTLEAALRIAERVFRGSNGETPGLGREGVYLESYVRVEAWLASAPGDELVLAAGQVSVKSVDPLRKWTSSSREA